MHWSLLFGLIVVVLVTAEAKISKNSPLKDRKLKVPSLKGLEEEWKAFKLKYKKHYKNAAEETLRKKIFADKLVEIKAHNSDYAKGLTSFTMGINQFTDMDTQEYVDRITGYVQSNRPKAQPAANVSVPLGGGKLPDSVDWWSKGYVTPVKHQHYHESCFAFGVTGTLEGQHFRKAGKLVSLSEQQLIDCMTERTHLDNALEYIASNGGIDTEESYPYEGPKGPCRYNPATKGATCNGYSSVLKTELHLQEAVATIGPVAVVINATLPSFQSYLGELYDDPECSGEEVNHAVLVIGYGKTEEGEEYWIVKNSYGRYWGMGGYMWLARNKGNLCGIANEGVYPIV